MIIKDKEIINTGTKLFNDVHRFKYACSEYFKLRYKGISHESIKEYLGLNEIQENFIKNLWGTPEYKKGYETEPWVIIMPVTTLDIDRYRTELVGHWVQNAIRENFTSFEFFRSKMVDFMYLRFNSAPLSEIQHSLELSDVQLSILLKLFNLVSEQIHVFLENAYSEGEGCKYAPIKQSVMRWWNGRYWESSAITEKPSCDTVENI